MTESRPADVSDVELRRQPDGVAKRRDTGRNHHDAINAASEASGPMYDAAPSPTAA